tara:strand:+ start:358 stop:549 length:192 start_codon:yes stop_codon:yes gene_type:complete
MEKHKTVSDIPNLPTESCGRCISTTREGERCTRKGTLADGLCIECWDKSVGYKDDLISSECKT